MSGRHKRVGLGASRDPIHERGQRENSLSWSIRGIHDLEALDMCLLGRDIAKLFAVIVDRPEDVVCLVRKPHRYVIEEK